MKKIILLILLLPSLGAFSQILEIDNPNKLIISPNPCESFTRFNFSLEKPDTVTLQIFNTMGVAIHSIFKKEFLRNGSYDIYYNTDTLKTGIYIVSLKVAGANFASKFVKLNTLTADSKSYHTKEFRAFPNPLRNNLIIDYAGPKKVEIRNMEGKIVLQLHTTSTVIDLPTLPDATYTLQVLDQTDKIILNQKIVKGE